MDRNESSSDLFVDASEEFPSNNAACLDDIWILEEVFDVDSFVLYFFWKILKHVALIALNNRKNIPRDLSDCIFALSNERSLSSEGLIIIYLLYLFIKEFLDFLEILRILRNLERNIKIKKVIIFN
jgi:hypothetical protein